MRAEPAAPRGWRRGPLAGALAAGLAGALTLGAALLAAPCLAQPGQGQPSHDHHPAPEVVGDAVEVVPFRLDRIPEAALVDQDGNPVRFKADLVEGQVVALNFVFTTCTTICPPMAAVFVRLQRELRQRGVGGVRFLSLSIDPATDTPQRLKAWAGRFGDAPGWTLLTGDKPTVDDLLKQLGVFSALKEDHAPILLLGDTATGRWTRAYGLAPPDRLADLLAELVREP